jgi:hypothetical protein
VDVCTFFQKILDNPFVASLSGVIESSYSWEASCPDGHTVMQKTSYYVKVSVIARGQQEGSQDIR